MNPSFAGTVFFSNHPGVRYRFRPDGSWEVFVRGRGPVWVHELSPGDVVEYSMAVGGSISHTGLPGLIVDRIVADDVAAVLES